MKIDILINLNDVGDYACGRDGYAVVLIVP